VLADARSVPVGLGRIELLAEPLIPCIANRYQLKRVLAQGGVGVVLSAEDLKSGQRVAVKVLKPDALARNINRARFEREARTAAMLRHPHLVEILDFGQDENGAPYLVTELLEGRSLAEELQQRKRIEPAELLGWLLPVIGALAHAHDRGVVHRDVKPANIFLSEDRDRDQGRDQGRWVVAKLLDFGIASSVDATRLTESHMAVGTLAYMAPEQIVSPDIVPSIDIWAAGAILYRCLSGTVPYGGRSIADQLESITRDPAPSLQDKAPGLDPGFCTAVERALQHRVDRRYPDMRTMARALLVAAAAAGIETPEQPDPLGLPDWPAWREQALRRDGATSTSL
jgi:serine/threonine protein kinase